MHFSQSVPGEPGQDGSSRDANPDLWHWSQPRSAAHPPGSKPSNHSSDAFKCLNFRFQRKKHLKNLNSDRRIRCCSSWSRISFSIQAPGSRCGNVTVNTRPSRQMAAKRVIAACEKGEEQGEENEGEEQEKEQPLKPTYHQLNSWFSFFWHSRMFWLLQKPDIFRSWWEEQR